MQKVYKRISPSIRPLQTGFLTLVDGLLCHTILPRICLICDQTTRGRNALCQHCQPWIYASSYPDKQLCLSCSVEINQENTHTKQQLEKNGDNYPVDGALHCAQCIKQPPRYSKCLSATAYNAFSGKLLNQLKHRGKLAASLPMASSLSQTINAYYGKPSAHIDTAIPVPLHIKRLRQRGFNQAAEIAKPLCRQLGIKVRYDLCIRNFDNPPQQHSGLAARHKNLRDAFYSLPAVKGKRVAVIDDVVTTGATANAVAKSLLDAGASHCDIWCFARTPRK